MDCILEVSVLNTMLNRYGLTAKTPHDVVNILRVLDSMGPLWVDPLQMKRDAEVYLMQSLLKKSKVLVSDPNLPKLAAYKQWRTTEARNGFTNLRLQTNPKLIGGYLTPILQRARTLCIKYMGKCPTYDQLVKVSDWATGATAEKARRFPVDRGLTDVVKIHYGASLLVRQFVCGFDRDTKFNSFRYCNYSTMDSVAKTFKTDRIIEKNLSAMVALQKGAGRIIRKSLLKYGLDLDNQAEVNRELCRASLQNGTCTIDLKEASDSITIELVKMLVDDDWYDLLSVLRNSQTRDLCGKIVTLEKFSANGNGFTFELETIIFRALTEATCEFCDINYPRHLVATFGDDIICPTNAAVLLTKVLSFCGFIVNREKSFLDGNFYESCGCHVAFNLDITPVYFKEAIKTLPQVIVAYNKLYRWSVKTGNFSFTRKALLLLRKYAVDTFGLGLVRTKVRGKSIVWDNIPEQPLHMKGDFGFIRESPGVYSLRGGKIVLRSAIVKSNVIVPVEREWFYFANRLRGGASFYSEVFTSEDDVCSLGRGDPGQESFTIKRNYGVWQSNMSSVRPNQWLPVEPICDTVDLSHTVEFLSVSKRKITSKVLKHLISD